MRKFDRLIVDTECNKAASNNLKFDRHIADTESNRIAKGIAAGFSQYFGFPAYHSTDCSTLINVHNPEADTIGQTVTDVASRSSLTTTEETKKKCI
jgi:hypothetical protein